MCVCVSLKCFVFVFCIFVLMLHAQNSSPVIGFSDQPLPMTSNVNYLRAPAPRNESWTGIDAIRFLDMEVWFLYYFYVCYGCVCVHFCVRFCVCVFIYMVDVEMMYLTTTAGRRRWFAVDSTLQRRATSERCVSFRFRFLFFVLFCFVLFLYKYFILTFNHFFSQKNDNFL